MSTEDEILVLCITASISPKNGEVKVIYVQNYDLLRDKEGIGLLGVYGILTPTWPEQGKRVVTAHDFIHE